MTGSGGTRHPLAPTASELPRGATRSLRSRSAHRLPRRGILLAADTAALVLSALVGLSVRAWLWPTPVSRVEAFPQLVALLPVMLAVLAAYGAYRRPARRLRSTVFPDLGRLGHGLMTGGLLMLSTAAVLRQWAGWSHVGWTVALAAMGPALLLVPALRALTLMVGTRDPRSRVVILGSAELGRRLAHRLAWLADIDFVGFVGDPVPSEQWLGHAGELNEICATYEVDRVVVASEDMPAETLRPVLRSLPPRVQLAVVPPMWELITTRSETEEVYGIPLLDVAPTTRGRLQRSLKRTMDLVGSVLLLIISSPLMILIGTAIRIESGAPVIFRQERSGRNRKPFVIYKFRTMRSGAETDLIALRDRNDMDGPIFKLRDDPRVTRVGRLLRRSGLDELPQLLNVVKGEMSLVGPRPFPVEEAASISCWGARRFEVRPGLTGYWQVSGRNEVSFSELQELDVAYVMSWSLWWDLKILWHTPAVVLGGRGLLQANVTADVLGGRGLLQANVTAEVLGGRGLLQANVKADETINPPVR